jgi:hypothetical protein
MRALIVLQNIWKIKHGIGNRSLGTLCSYIMPNTAYFSLELGQCSLLYVLWHTYYLKLAHLLRFRIVISLVPFFSILTFIDSSHIIPSELHNLYAKACASSFQHLAVKYE